MNQSAIISKVSNLTPLQQLITAFLLVMTGVSGGVIYENHQTQQIDDQFIIKYNEFDIFSYKAQDDVKPMMDIVLGDPTEYNLRYANNHLKMGLTNWAYRNEGDNKERFIQYLAACELVIDEKQAGHDITEEKAEMEKSYKKLNPEE